MTHQLSAMLSIIFFLLLSKGNYMALDNKVLLTNYSSSIPYSNLTAKLADE